MDSGLKDNKYPVSFSITMKDIQMEIFFILNMCVGKTFRKKYNNNYVWEKRLSRTWHTGKDKKSFPVHLQVKSAAQIQYLLNQVTRDIIFQSEKCSEKWGVIVSQSSGTMVSLCDWTLLKTKEMIPPILALGAKVCIRLLKEYRWFKVTYITENPTPPWALTHKSWDHEVLCPTCIQLHWKI